MTAAELLSKLKQNRLQEIADDRATDEHYDEDDREMHDAEISRLGAATDFGKWINACASSAWDAPSIIAAVIRVATTDHDDAPEMDFDDAPTHYDT